MGGSNGELQNHTKRLVDIATAYGMEVSTEKSNIRTNSTNNISADIRMIGQNLEEVTSFRHLGATLQRWHMLNRSLHQDYLSNGSNGQTKQDLAVQHHELRKQVQALRVSCHLHPPLRL